MNKFIIRITSTFFFVGFFPFIPGTFGSLAGLMLFYLISFNKLLVIFSTVFLIIIGFAVGTAAEKIFMVKDSRFIVIDEVAGMFISLLFIPLDPRLVIMAFFFFRMFDTIKPYPAYKIQSLPGSIGIMGDDIVAGIYTNVLIQLFLKVNFLIGS